MNNLSDGRLEACQILHDRRFLSIMIDDDQSERRIRL